MQAVATINLAISRWKPATKFKTNITFTYNHAQSWAYYSLKNLQYLPSPYPGNFLQHDIAGIVMKCFYRKFI